MATVKSIKVRQVEHPNQKALVELLAHVAFKELMKQGIQFKPSRKI